MALSARLLTLRRSPILLKLPPYLSAICILVGIIWILLLPLNDYSRQTYISENAILPGQVHTYFGGSEHNIFRAYRQEVYDLGQKSPEVRIEDLERIIKEFNLKSATQKYAFEVAGERIEGTNVYGLLQGPRADATEAMVLIAAWKNFEGQINYSGVALALTLARYFKRWSIWSKDVILLIPEDSTYGPEAWVSAYHSTGVIPTASRNVSALPIKAGALQGAVALDYPVGPWGKRFDKLDVLYDGINGALPNLDLINTAVQIASGQMGIGCSLHGLTKHSDKYDDRLRTIASGILTQAQGVATGPHSAFMPYRVDAITLKTVGDGWHDEMSFGRVTESVFRSINNLLEHLHQSFFFYILLNTNRFVSIGSYLPAAMLVAGSFTINALALWLLSGKGPVQKPGKLESEGSEQPKGEKMVKIKEGDNVALVAKKELQSVERKMFLPAAMVLGVHLISLVPLYLLTHTHKTKLPYAFGVITTSSYLLPVYLSILLVRYLRASSQQLQTMQSFSLLLLGGTLSTWATLNFSLALTVGLLASPIGFIRPLPLRSSAGASDKQRTLAIALSVPAALLWLALSPPATIYALSWYAKLDVGTILFEVAKGWTAQGVWSCLVLWSIWWPGWVLAGTVLFSGAVRTAT
ncbi:Putative GPI transamidase component Gaa1 [Septoria linicola]|uniref:GPI transamidase component Gaa1 n=1 Tax=Septoria linicola TaxID=215465 RepID=A0A9Q9B862_9PEZI|nr:putative GPI transamidase component Gaa1 [Septoria linicola]USW59173.1 Putative GPI transamidase component Gaa1 [Septoria linicola]